MKPLRIRIDRIVDFGKVVCLVGIDTATLMAVTIHVDHRPFAAVRKALREAGLPRPIEYEASRLLLHLDLVPDQDADQVNLIQLDSSSPAPSCDHVPAVQELDR